MRKLPLLLFIFVIAFYTIIAQSELKSGCPTVSVIVPSGVTNPGDLIEFSASLLPETPQNIEYFWSVDQGNIVKGQRTKTIGVDWPGMGTIRVAASVTVKGLPSGCPNTATDDYAMVVDPGPEKIGEISNLDRKIDRVLRSKIKEKLSTHEQAQLYVILYGSKEKSQSLIRRYKNLILRQLITGKMEQMRIVFITSVDYSQKAVFWLILPGVNKPTP